MQKALKLNRKLFLTDRFIQFFTKVHSTSLPLTAVDPLTLSTANRTQTAVMSYIMNYCFEVESVCPLTYFCWLNKLLRLFTHTEYTHGFMYAALSGEQYAYISIYEQKLTSL